VAVTHTRRAPVQERSRQRIADILSTTAVLVDELGPDDVTTTLIAQRLGVSVGSIYTYFDDRSAIFDAIVARSIAAHDEMVARIGLDGPSDDWFATADAIIDSLVAVYRTEPGFRSLWFSRHLSPDTLEVMRRTDEAQARAALAHFTALGFDVDAANPLDAMRLYVGLVDKGLDLAFRLDPQGKPEVITETKRVVRLYLGACLTPLSGSTAQRRHSTAARSSS
jgi:AcrR family transcriptional regulator